VPNFFNDLEQVILDFVENHIYLLKNKKLKKKANLNLNQVFY